jgi:hypothetical protein
VLYFAWISPRSRRQAAGGNRYRSPTGRATTRSWLGQAAYIDAAHLVYAQGEDALRTGKDGGIGEMPPPR